MNCSCDGAHGGEIQGSTLRSKSAGKEASVALLDSLYEARGDSKYISAYRSQPRAAGQEY